MTEASILVLFPSVHFALKLERALKRNKLPVEMVPVPRELSADCGICAKAAWSNAEKVIDLLHKKKIDYDAIYRCADGKFTRHRENRS